MYKVTRHKDGTISLRGTYEEMVDIRTSLTTTQPWPVKMRQNMHSAWRVLFAATELANEKAARAAEKRAEKAARKTIKCGWTPRFANSFEG